ncbi:alpha/beta hydrolase [Temperatibacter marinus]|uniref:Alpha/beta hydrolase n=1 Tax=Temperatibacter marinus TaxID=1456591 RepID=A0AA52EHI3_9PROT|nr:alpha/beta hydrolase [Temperatibacter marinus]WND02890.1 alpha/beta hydrolase [Temperatibacter marinus]
MKLFLYFLLCILMTLFGAVYAEDQKPEIMTAQALGNFPAPIPDHTIFYGGGAPQFGELWMPKTPVPENGFPVIMFIHGGCWYAEYDIKHTRNLTKHLSDAGFAVWSVEFRRIGHEGGGFPGTFDDILTSGKALDKLAGPHRLDLSRVVVSGHSAGGHLALWYGREAKIKPKAVLAMAPAADLSYLSKEQTCGNAATKLMGGSPKDKAEAYKMADTALNPLQTVPQTIFIGKYDKTWTPVALRYVEVLKEKMIAHTVIEAPLSGHFEMIDPRHKTFSLLVKEFKRLAN